MRCSNDIRVINNFIAYWGATYIRGLTVNQAIIVLDNSLSNIIGIKASLFSRHSDGSIGKKYAITIFTHEN